MLKNRFKIFWEQHEKFKTHPLQTELPNPVTHKLSHLAGADVKEAIRLLQHVDVHAVKTLQQYVPQLVKLKKQIKEILNKGNKIFMCGCGSSGRLAVALEFLWKHFCNQVTRDKVIGFIGGGDNAIVKAIEGFEDQTNYGVKQLLEAGFNNGDLLISITASGESPFVLGATAYAAKTSVGPWFIHCNTDEALKGRIKDHVIHHSNVNSIALFVGSMALTGSTRMQAATVAMLGVGLCLYDLDIEEEIKKFSEYINLLDTSVLADLIIAEADTYKANEYVIYDTDPNYALTVLTDTTERTPTFNLDPFENKHDAEIIPSLCYLLISAAEDTEKAWDLILGRYPRTLGWDDETSLNRLYGFDFSKKNINFRKRHASPSHSYNIKRNGDNIELSFKHHKAVFSVVGFNPLAEQILLKIILNTSSTIVMGRLGYYKGNFMTSLYPSNSKLIDRAIRYINFLVNIQTENELPYEEVANYLFEELKHLSSSESVVFKTVDTILSKLPEK